MSETTKEERDMWRERLEEPTADDTHQFWRSGIVFELLNDADRLAELEQQNRNMLTAMQVIAEKGDKRIAELEAEVDLLREAHRCAGCNGILVPETMCMDCRDNHK